MSRPPRPLSPAARKLRDEVLARTDPDRPPSWLDPATVDHIAVGAGTDGADLVYVVWHGVTVPVAHLASYAPAAGHVVLLNVQGPSLVIVGRVVGTPPTT